MSRLLAGSRHAIRCSRARSEEHTSELQSQLNLVCRLLLEKKKEIYSTNDDIIPLAQIYVNAGTVVVHVAVGNVRLSHVNPDIVLTFPSSYFAISDLSRLLS